MEQRAHEGRDQASGTIVDHLAILHQVCREWKSLRATLTDLQGGVWCGPGHRRDGSCAAAELGCHQVGIRPRIPRAKWMRAQRVLWRKVEAAKRSEVVAMKSFLFVNYLS